MYNKCVLLSITFFSYLGNDDVIVKKGEIFDIIKEKLQDDLCTQIGVIQEYFTKKNRQFEINEENQNVLKKL